MANAAEAMAQMATATTLPGVIQRKPWSLALFSSEPIESRLPATGMVKPLGSASQRPRPTRTEEVPMNQRRDLIVSRGWPQACLLVVLLGHPVDYTAA